MDEDGFWHLIERAMGASNNDPDEKLEALEEEACIDVISAVKTRWAFHIFLLISFLVINSCFELDISTISDIKEANVYKLEIRKRYKRLHTNPGETANDLDSLTVFGAKSFTVSAFGITDSNKQNKIINIIKEIRNDLGYRKIIVQFYEEKREIEDDPVKIIEKKGKRVSGRNQIQGSREKIEPIRTEVLGKWSYKSPASLSLKEIIDKSDIVVVGKIILDNYPKPKIGDNFEFSPSYSNDDGNFGICTIETSQILKGSKDLENVLIATPAFRKVDAEWESWTGAVYTHRRSGIWFLTKNPENVPGNIIRKVLSKGDYYFANKRERYKELDVDLIEKITTLQGQNK